MKKNIKTKKLGRNRQTRQALFRALVKELVRYGSLTTTLAKAKVVRSLFEKILTHAKTGTLAAHRQAQTWLQSPTLVKKLVSELAPQYQSRPGGYTRLTPLLPRRGDSAPLARLSLLGHQHSTASNTVISKSSSKSSKSPSSVSPLPTPKPSRVSKRPTPIPSANVKNKTVVKRGER